MVNKVYGASSSNFKRVCESQQFAINCNKSMIDTDTYYNLLKIRTILPLQYTSCSLRQASEEGKRTFDERAQFVNFYFIYFFADEADYGSLSSAYMLSPKCV